MKHTKKNVIELLNKIVEQKKDLAEHYKKRGETIKADILKKEADAYKIACGIIADKEIFDLVLDNYKIK